MGSHPTSVNHNSRQQSMGAANPKLFPGNKNPVFNKQEQKEREAIAKMGPMEFTKYTVKQEGSLFLST